MSSVVVNDVLEELNEENKRLLNELLFSNKCLNALTQFTAFIDFISDKIHRNLDSNELLIYKQLNQKVIQLLARLKTNSREESIGRKVRFADRLSIDSKADEDYDSEEGLIVFPCKHIQCSKVFPSRMAYVQHWKEKHSSSLAISPKIIRNTSGNSESVPKTAIKSTILTCPVNSCKRVFISKKSLEEHTKKGHIKKRGRPKKCKNVEKNNDRDIPVKRSRTETMSTTTRSTSAQNQRPLRSTTNGILPEPMSIDYKNKKVQLIKKKYSKRGRPPKTEKMQTCSDSTKPQEVKRCVTETQTKTIDRHSRAAQQSSVPSPSYGILPDPISIGFVQKAFNDKNFLDQYSSIKYKRRGQPPLKRKTEETIRNISVFEEKKGLVTEKKNTDSEPLPQNQRSLPVLSYVVLPDQMPKGFIEKTYSKARIKCYFTSCEMSFNTLDELHFHLDDFHNLIKCQNCDLRFSTKQQLRRHNISCGRPKIRSLTCYNCLQKFVTKYELRAHHKTCLTPEQLAQTQAKDWSEDTERVDNCEEQILPSDETMAELTQIELKYNPNEILVEENVIELDLLENNNSNYHDIRVEPI